MRVAPIFFLLATLGLCGCFGTYNTATPTPEGTWEVVVAPSVLGTFESNEVFGLPSLDLGVRRGISEGVDLGFQTNLFGLQVDANFAPILTDSFALSLNPGVAIVRFPGFFSSDDKWISFVKIGVLVDILKTDSVVLTLGLEPGAGTEVNEMKPLFYTTGLFTARFRVSELLWVRPGVEATMPFLNINEGFFLRLSLALIF